MLDRPKQSWVERSRIEQTVLSLRGGANESNRRRLVCDRRLFL